MLNKKILFCGMLVLMLYSFSALAASSIIPVPVEVQVDFDGERDFRILMPNGYERHFEWSGNQTHSDVVFVHDVYYTLNESLWCTESQEQINQFENLTTSILGVTDSCNGVVDSFNKTFGINGEQWLVQQNRVEDAENKTDMCKDELDKVKDEKSSCQTSLSSCRVNQNKYEDCEDELENKGDYDFFHLILAAAAGAFLYHLYKGKKGGNGSSEQVQSGYVGDNMSSGQNGGFPLPQRKAPSRVNNGNSRPGPKD